MRSSLVEMEIQATAMFLSWCECVSVTNTMTEFPGNKPMSPYPIQTWGQAKIITPLLPSKEEEKA